jgi:hypothetical protein
VIFQFIALLFQKLYFKIEFFNISKSIQSESRISNDIVFGIDEIQSSKCSLHITFDQFFSVKFSAKSSAVLASGVNLSNGFIKLFKIFFIFYIKIYYINFFYNLKKFIDSNA